MSKKEEKKPAPVSKDVAAEVLWSLYGNPLMLGWSISEEPSHYCFGERR